MNASELLTAYDQQRIYIEYPGTRKEVLPLGMARFVRPAPGINFVLDRRPQRRPAPGSLVRLSPR